MISIKRVFQILFIGFLFLSWGCGKKQTSALTLGINPSQPLLIPVSSTVNGTSGTVGPAAPYFTVNSLRVTWAGAQTFQLLAITFYAGNITSGSNSTASSFSCGGSGSGVNFALFGNASVVDCKANVIQPALDALGNLTIPAPADPTCPYSVQSTQFFCDSLPITVSPNPFASYNIPIEVIVFGESLDATGDATGRVTGIANITVD